MTDAAPARPAPVPDDGSQPYWDATARGELALARCSACQRFVHPPGPVCPHCGTTEPALAFAVVPGTGRICSWTVVHQSSLRAFEADVPFTLVDVQLDGAAEVRLIGRLLDGPAALDAAVTVAFEPLPDGSAVPAFSLVDP